MYDMPDEIDVRADRCAADHHPEPAGFAEFG